MKYEASTRHIKIQSFLRGCMDVYYSWVKLKLQGISRPSTILMADDVPFVIPVLCVDRWASKS